MTGFDDVSQSLSLLAFTTIATITLLLCVMTGPDRDELDEFYTGYSSLSPMRNGLAIAGDYISGGMLLSVGGVIAITGYDGVVMAMSMTLSLLLLMFCLAEPLRNVGRFTLGDVLALRAPGRPVRIAACTVTVIVLVPVMLLQLAGTGDLMGVVLGFSNEAFRIGCIVGIGALMISYAAIGGMKGTALVQILKIVMLLGSGAVVAALLLRQFDWNLGRLFSAAAEGSGAGSSFLSPGLQFSSGSHPKLDMISANLTAVIGGACLPHVTMRMYTASSSREVRRSMSWAVSSVTLFVLIITVISFGATALVGPATIMESDAHGGTAYLLGSRAALGSTVSAIEAFLFAMVTTALFLTLLASVAGMTLACANTLAHDLFASGARPKTPRRELTLARLSAVAVGLPTILLAALLRHHNMLPLGMLSASISASALAPAMIYSLFWRRYTRTGLLYTLIGGTLCAIVLTTGTNQVSGFAYSLFPDADFNWFPFTTTGLVSVPVGFALGWLGTMVSERREVEEQRRTYEAVEASILAGAARRGD